jgi:PIN domain
MNQTENKPAQDSGPTAKPSCIVLDTNAWYHDPLLNGSIGAALLYYAQQTDALLGLPGVIERELVKHGVRKGLEAAGQVVSGLSVLERFTGVRPIVELPDEKAFADSLQRRLNDLERLIVRTPFTHEDAIAALDRVNSDLPPNGPKNQQFKDSAIWEALLRLGEAYSVEFVTNDNAFYQGRDCRTERLAINLQEDCRNRNVAVRIYSSISSLLKNLKASAPPVDTRLIASSVAAIIADQLQTAAAQRSLDLGDLVFHEISTFATEAFGKLAISFSLTFRLVDSSPDEGQRQNASLTAVGTCGFDMETKTSSDAQFDTLEYTWVTETGERRQVRDIFLRMSDAIRSRVVPYTLREPI